MGFQSPVGALGYGHEPHAIDEEQARLDREELQELELEEMRGPVADEVPPPPTAPARRRFRLPHWLRMRS